MRLSALFSVARAEAFGADSQVKIQQVLDALNAHLAKHYPSSKAVYGSLRALFMHHPDALQVGEVSGLADALGDGYSTMPARESFDLLTGYGLDGDDPARFYGFLEPYMSGVTGLSPSTLLLNEFQGSAASLFIEQNILDPDIALRGLRSWIRYSLPQALEKGKVIPGIGMMSWAIFESNTSMRVMSTIHATYVSYFMDKGINPSELSEIAQSLVTQAAIDFATYDVGSFENWLKNDYLIDMLVYNPALACCLRGVPTAQIVERVSPIISILLRDIALENQKSEHQDEPQAISVRQGLINALCLFPERLREISSTAREIAGADLPAPRAISLSTTASNRLSCSPLDALQVSGCEHWLAIRTLGRLEGRGLCPDMEMSAKAALENRVKSVVLLTPSTVKTCYRTIEEYFVTVDPTAIPDLDHAHIRNVIDYLHLPAYSELARLNMALTLVHRAIDIHKSRLERGMKRNNLVPLTFKSPSKVVADWKKSMPIILRAFEEKGLYSHHMMVWAGFDSSVLQILSPEAPRSIRDTFMAQDLGL